MEGYGIIYSDPPWRHPRCKGGPRRSRPGASMGLGYKTIGIPEIAGIHRRFAALAAPRHNFFMWAIDALLPEAEGMMAAEGYALHARLVWDKGNGPCPAFTLRYTHEYLLWFYRKGRMLMPDARGVFTTVIREPHTEHSRKPEAAYRMIERMFPAARKIELFARRRREGWDAFGDELGPHAQQTLF